MNDSELMDSYMLVARCWNNPRGLASRPMTTGEAIGRLRAATGAKSQLLRLRATLLLDEIVYLQAPIEGVDVGCAAQ